MWPKKKEPAPGLAPERYARREAVFHWGGEGLLAASLPEADAPVLVPAFLAEFQQACSGFRTLEEHVARYGHRHRLPSAELSPLLDAARGLADAGLLFSASDLVRQLSERAGSDPAPITHLGFPTADAPIRLERAIGSFAARAAVCGHAPELLVADNSRDPAVSARNREALHAAAARHGLPFRWLGPETRADAADRLADAAGCRRETLRFALCRDGRFAAGANRNALLLAAAGGRLFSADDDALCEAWLPPEPRAGLGFAGQSDPMERAFYPSRAEGLAAFAARGQQPVDCLGEHARLLGCTAGECLARLDPGASGIAEARMPAPFLERLLAGEARVVATYSGNFLDPGIPTSCYYLGLEAESLDRLALRESPYHLAMRSRAASGVAPRATLGDFSLTPGIAFALDLSGDLPPFFPLHHAEDFSHGALLACCLPDALSGYPPFALLHDPGDGKPIIAPGDLESLRPAALFEFAHALRWLIRSAGIAPAGSSPEEGMARIAAKIGECVGPGERAFAGAWRELVLETQGRQCERLERRLWEEPGLPDWVREDIGSVLTHARRALERKDFDIPQDLDRPGISPEAIRSEIRSDLALFAELLEVWPSVLRAAREIGMG